MNKMSVDRPIVQLQWTVDKMGKTRNKCWYAITPLDIHMSFLSTEIEFYVVIIIIIINQSECYAAVL